MRGIAVAIMNCSSVRNRPMPAAPVSSMCGRSTSRPALMQQRDAHAVAGDAGLVAQRVVLRLAARAQPHALGIGALDVGRRAHMHVAGNAVDDDGIVRFDEAGGVGDLAHGRDAERARHDGHMRGRRRPPPAPGRAAACGRSRAAPPAPWSAPRGSRSPASARAPARGPAPSAGASGGWRDRRGRAGDRADTGRSGAACARACRTARARPPASAVRPVITASRSRCSQPRSWANMR